MILAITLDVLDVIILCIILFILLSSSFVLLVSHFKTPKRKGKRKMTDEQFWIEFQQILQEVDDKGDEALIQALNSAPWYKEDRIKQEDEEDAPYRKKIVK